MNFMVLTGKQVFPVLLGKIGFTSFCEKMRYSVFGGKKFFGEKM